MRKFLKVISLIFGSLILLAVLAMVAVITLVSPNRFKPLIVSQLTKYTGRTIILDKDLAWTFFPNIGVKIDHIIINNPVTFKEKTFAELSDAIISVKLLPLLAGKIESNGISFNAMKLTLIKNVAGQVNWQLQSQVVTQKGAANGSSQVLNPSSQSSSSSYDQFGAIDNITVKSADITYINEQTKQTYRVRNLQLDANHFQLAEAFPLTTEFDVSSNQSTATGHMALSGEVLLQPNNQTYSYQHLILKASIKQNKTAVNASLAGNVQANLAAQTLQWHDFVGKVGEVELAGAIDVNKLSTKPTLTGKIHISPFNSSQLVKALNMDAANLPLATNIRGDIILGAVTQAKIKIDTIQFNHRTLSAIVADATYQNGILNINPFAAKLFQGDLRGQATVNINAIAPRVALNALLTNAQLNALQSDASQQKLKITGLANVEMHVTTSGSGDAILRNLNGTAHFNVANGALVGVDLDYLIGNAVALATHQLPSVTNAKETRFNTLSGSAVIQNGVINNQDLQIDSAFLTVRGKGAINLPNQQIDYALANSIKKRSNDERDAYYNLYGTAIPVTITGGLNDPHVQLDTNTILKIIAQRQLQRLQKKATEKVQEKLQDAVKGKLSPQASQLLGNILGQ